MGVLFPDPKDVRFWHELYGREDDEMNESVTGTEMEGAEVIGPMDTSGEDPILLATKEGSDGLSGFAPANQTPPQSLSSTPTVSGSANLEKRTLSPLSASLWSSSSNFTQAENPSRPRSRSAGGAAIQPSSSPTPNTSRPGVEPRLPWNMDSGQQQELLRGIGDGAKSMWGKLSSRASTAFTAVQGAYGDVTREMKGMPASQGWATGTESDGKELQGRGNVLTDYRDVSMDAEASWSRSTPAKEQVTVPSWAADTQVPTERWKTERITQGLSSLSLENPWQTFPSKSERQSTTRTHDVSSRFGKNAQSPSSSATAAQSGSSTSPELDISQAKTSSSDPLGVL